MSKVYFLIHDKQKSLTRTYYKNDEELFKKLNKEGWGIYSSVNDFDATTEEMSAIGAKTKRNIPFLKKINHVFADLDVAKAEDGQSRSEKEEKKLALTFALYSVCPPSFIVDTSNGLQPYWELSSCPTDSVTQGRYVDLINGIIAWSKGFGAMGDIVKDVTRVLRLPGYFHMKEEPYLVTVKQKEGFVYTLESLEDSFREYIKHEEKVFKKTDVSRLDDLSRAIELLDFQEVVVRAFSSIGRRAEFDNQKRLILDGRLTGTHQGKTGDGRFLASSSHEPFVGNVITAPANIKQITNKEARAWLIEEFGLRASVQKKKALEVMKPKELRPLKNYYSWGTRELTESFAPIKQTTYSVIGGGYGVGKTPFCINMALENVKLGHNVLYLSLEMDTEEIHDHLARKAAFIDIPEEIYNNIPENKLAIYNAKRKELESLKGFSLKGVRGGVKVSWEALVGLVEGDFDLIFVDNFNLIQRIDGLSQHDHEGELSSRFLGLALDKQVPVVVVHHYSKGGARELQKTGYSLGGNAKIMNDAQRIVLLERKTIYSEDETPPTEKDKAVLKVLLDKGRSYDRGITKVIYFHRGSFHDHYPGDKPVMWQDNI